MGTGRSGGEQGAMGWREGDQEDPKEERDEDRKIGGAQGMMGWG